MAAIDVGDPLPGLAVRVENPPGTPVNVGEMAVTVTLPDGSSTALTATNPTTGSYVLSGPYFATTGGLHRVRWVATGANACVKEQYRSVGDPVDIDEVRAELRITGSASDDLLYRHIAAATDRVESWTGRSLRAQTLTVVRDGGKYAVSLPRTPVASVVSVSVNGTAVAADTWTLVERTGILHRGAIGSGAYWPSGQVSVTYTTAPAVADRYRQAVVEYVRYLLAGQRGSTGQPSAGASPEEALARSRQLAGPGGGGFI